MANRAFMLTLLAVMAAASMLGPAPTGTPSGRTVRRNGS